MTIKTLLAISWTWVAMCCLSMLLSILVFLPVRVIELETGFSMGQVWNVSLWWILVPGVVIVGSVGLLLLFVKWTGEEVRKVEWATFRGHNL